MTVDPGTAGEVSPLAEPDIEAAQHAARLLMRNPHQPLPHEPRGAPECHAAVEELARQFAAGGETLAEIVENSRGGAESLSSDPLQGFSEIIQNANDAAATGVDFHLDGDVLVVRHDGRPVNLRDLRAMSVPWLTTKREEEAATGRFGVGLSTLHAVADTFEIHSGDYHVRVGAPFISNLSVAPSDLAPSPETLLRVVLSPGMVSDADFLEWWKHWDDRALMFLGNVRRITFASAEGDGSLALTPVTEERHTWRRDEGNEVEVVTSRLESADGRRWLRAITEVPSPKDLERSRKKKGPTTVLGVALPLFGQADRDGVVHAGLPVTSLDGIPALINAQFDPVTGRQGLLDSQWNMRLASMTGELWVHTIRHLFGTSPKKAWRCIPIPGDAVSGPTTDAPDRSPENLVDRLKRAIQEGADSVAEDLLVPLDGGFAPLGGAATESEDLVGLLTPDQVVSLASAEYRLPDEARDNQGRWRDVLARWRTTTSTLPPEVTLKDALTLLDSPRMPIAEVLRLTSAAIQADLTDALWDLACLVEEAGSASRPPSPDSPVCVTNAARGLAADLGLAIVLHPAYNSDAPGAAQVREWLEASGSLVEPDDEGATLERLARAGLARFVQPQRLNDTELARLRLAMEPLSAADLNRLGRGIGRAILIDGYQFDTNGAQVARIVTPHSAYLPKRIDTVKDGFFTAAGHAPGLIWAANRYTEILRSDLPRGVGLGAQKFLRALGASTSPRIVRHPENARKYVDRRCGLPKHVGFVTARTRALARLEADYTLDDWDCPDLMRVLLDIAAETNPRRRRQRAGAVIETLGRAWRDLGDYAEVNAAYAYNQWNVLGHTKAFWLWRAGSVPWLDNSLGEPAAPLELRRQTRTNVGLFRHEPESLVHQDFVGARDDVLDALGVSREPEAHDLITRLRQMSERQSDPDTLAECAIVYQALANRVANKTLGYSLKQLRDEMGQRGGLIRTGSRWVAPRDLLMGDPVFGSRREFVPTIPGTEPLWRALQVPKPSLNDCLMVLTEIARTKEPPSIEDETIMLETLRLMTTLSAARSSSAHGKAATGRTRIARRLAALPLFTSQGWVTKRPIYVVADPQVADGISDQVPVWQVGADPSQFAILYRELRLTVISHEHVSILNADQAYEDDDAQVAYSLAMDQFKADLTRNAPQLERTLTVPWPDVEALRVRVHPALEASVAVPGGKPLSIPIGAHVDRSAGVLFLRSDNELRRVEGVGRALAALFEADERALAYTWLAAVLKAEEGAQARALELSNERQAREALLMKTDLDRLREIQQEGQTPERGTRRKKRNETKNPPPTQNPETNRSPAPLPPEKPRVLVDLERLVITDPAGQIVNEHRPAATLEPPGPRSERRNADPNAKRRLAEPDPDKAPPKPSASYRAYSDEQKERLGLRIASRVLAGDDGALMDLRNQRNVGADAMDDLGRYYELKVFANNEGDTITLEPSQIERALSEPKFFLVVVSNLEGVNAKPKVRIIVDPIRQLLMSKQSKIKFSGIQESRSLVYTLAPSEAEDGD